MKVVVPLRTGTGQNDREHFRARARRVKHERLAVAWMLAVHKPPTGPVTVTLCRVSPGNGLDAHDNLRGSLKAPVDQVAEWLGRDDRDPSITWAYEQRRGAVGIWLVEISVLQIPANSNCETVRLGPGIVESGLFVASGHSASMRRDDCTSRHDVNDAAPASVDDLCSRKEREASGMDGCVHSISVGAREVMRKGAKP